jgi:hypothetical protein
LSSTQAQQVGHLVMPGVRPSIDGDGDGVNRYTR